MAQATLDLPVENQPESHHNIRIGTSGFAYDDWVGSFYPPSLRPPQRLEYYAQRFNTLEVNSTYYNLPALPGVYGMLRKVPNDFDFFVKAHRDTTHGTLKNAKDTMSKFSMMLDVYDGEGRLAGALFQFPATFACTPKNEDYLRWVVESLEKTRVVVEFRHARWINDKTMDFLRELNAGYCIVDMPQVRDLPSSRIEATCPIAYFRFHGQNSPKWEGAATRDERYDYEYTEEQLQDWVEPITNLSKYVEETYVFFNNHYRGKAAKNAQMLQELLKNHHSQEVIP